MLNETFSVIFKHLCNFGYRAQIQRPDYKRTRLGINKAKQAITNCLSKTNGFDFLDMKEIIEDIQRKEREQERLEKEREEAELKALEKELLPDEEGTTIFFFREIFFFNFSTFLIYFYA